MIDQKKILIKISSIIVKNNNNNKLKQLQTKEMLSNSKINKN